MALMIDVIDLLEARDRYHSILNELGKKFMYGAPTIQRFLSPANWSRFPEDLYEAQLPAERLTWDLSITGEARYNILFSPHAKSLVAAVLLKDR